MFFIMINLPDLISLGKIEEAKANSVCFIFPLIAGLKESHCNQKAKAAKIRLLFHDFKVKILGGSTCCGRGIFLAR